MAIFYVNDQGSDIAGGGLTEGAAYLTIRFALLDIHATHAAINAEPVQLYVRGNVHTGGDMTDDFVNAVLPWPTLDNYRISLIGYAQDLDDQGRAGVDCDGEPVIYTTNSNARYFSFFNLNFTNDEQDGTGCIGLRFWCSVINCDFVTKARASVYLSNYGFLHNVMSDNRACTLSSALGIYGGGIVSISDCVSYANAGYSYYLLIGLASRCVGITNTGNAFGSSGDSACFSHCTAIGLTPTAAKGGFRNTNRIKTELINCYAQGFSGVGGMGFDLPYANRTGAIIGCRTNDCETPFVVSAGYYAADNEDLPAAGLVDAAGGNFAPLPSMVNASGQTVGALPQAASSGVAQSPFSTS